MLKLHDSRLRFPNFKFQGKSKAESQSEIETIGKEFLERFTTDWIEGSRQGIETQRKDQGAG